MIQLEKSAMLPPEREPLQVVVNGTRLGEVKPYLIDEWHASFDVPVPDLGDTELIQGFGHTPEDAINDAMRNAVRRTTAIQFAVQHFFDFHHPFSTGERAVNTDPEEAKPTEVLPSQPAEAVPELPAPAVPPPEPAASPEPAPATCGPAVDRAMGETLCGPLPQADRVH